MGNTLSTKRYSYYNRVALLHILFLVVLYAVIDGVLINYSVDENALSKGFYSKLLISFLYFLGSRDAVYSSRSDSLIDAAFHFSVFLLCFWMGVKCLLLTEVEISRIIGIFLIFGGLAAFNLVDELLKVVRLKISSQSVLGYLIETLLKIFLFSIFSCALYFLVVGDWVWQIKPFYEW